MTVKRVNIILLVLLLLIASVIFLLRQDKPDVVGSEAGAAGQTNGTGTAERADGAGISNRTNGYVADALTADLGDRKTGKTVPDSDQDNGENAQPQDPGNNDRNDLTAYDLLNEEGSTVSERISVPQGFERIKLEEGSFGQYLRDFPLKPHGTKVVYYDGRTKPWDVHAAVLDIDIGDRDLQQCADAAIRLRAEYLYSKGLYEQIHFNFTNGFNAEYVKWMEGSRIRITGNRAEWVRQGNRDTGYESFRKYLDMVFTYAGTLSLSQEMKNISTGDAQPGDVFLKGGSPGHCVIIVDMAEHTETGEKIFIAAQSYMPAQSIHILKNPANDDGNPWYPLDFGDELVTPEWTFTKDQVFRFAD